LRSEATETAAHRWAAVWENQYGTGTDACHRVRNASETDALACSCGNGL